MKSNKQMKDIFEGISRSNYGDDYVNKNPRYLSRTLPDKQVSILGSGDLVVHSSFSNIESRSISIDEYYEGWEDDWD